MSYNILTFLNKTTYRNDNYHRFPQGTTYDQVLNWCISHDIKGFEKDNRGIFTAKSPQNSTRFFYESLSGSIPLHNGYNFYIIIQIPSNYIERTNLLNL